MRERCRLPAAGRHSLHKALAVAQGTTNCGIVNRGRASRGGPEGTGSNYLHVGAPQDAEGEETPEGHVLRFEPGTQRIVGLTVINARWLLDRDGHLTITIPRDGRSQRRRPCCRARRG
jgi:hypothetical protein